MNVNLPVCAKEACPGKGGAVVTGPVRGSGRRDWDFQSFLAGELGQSPLRADYPGEGETAREAGPPGKGKSWPVDEPPAEPGEEESRVFPGIPLPGWGEMVLPAGDRVLAGGEGAAVPLDTEAPGLPVSGEGGLDGALLWAAVDGPAGEQVPVPLAEQLPAEGEPEIFRSDGAADRHGEGDFAAAIRFNEPGSLQLPARILENEPSPGLKNRGPTPTEQPPDLNQPVAAKTAVDNRESAVLTAVEADVDGEAARLLPPAGPDQNALRGEKGLPAETPPMVSAPVMEGETAVISGPGSLLSANGPAAGGEAAAAAKVGRNLLDQLQAHVTYLRARGEFPAEIRLKLDPPQLGEILVRVVSNQGRLSAEILAVRAPVKEMLSLNLGELQQRLEQVNLHLERIDLFTAGELSFGAGHYSGSEGSLQWAQNDGGRPKVDSPEKIRPSPGRGSVDNHRGIVNYWV